MDSKNMERLMELCEQAAVEQDPKKLLQMTTEINLLLTAKHGRLKGNPQPDKLQTASGTGPDADAVR
jgi:hypothetical protein